MTLVTEFFQWLEEAVYVVWHALVPRGASHSKTFQTCAAIARRPLLSIV